MTEEELEKIIAILGHPAVTAKTIMADVEEPESPNSSGEDIPAAPEETQPAAVAEEPDEKLQTTSKDDTVPADTISKAIAEDGDVPAVTTSPPADAKDIASDVKSAELRTTSKDDAPIDASGEAGRTDTSTDVSRNTETRSSIEAYTSISTGRKVTDIELETPLTADRFTELSSARKDIYGKDDLGSADELWTSQKRTWSSSSKDEDPETEKTMCDVFHCDDCTLHKNKQDTDSLPLSLASEAPPDGAKSPCPVCQKPGCGVCTVFKDVNRWSGTVGRDYGQKSRQVKFGDYGYETGGSSSSAYRTGGWSESGGYGSSSRRGYTIETVETSTTSNWNKAQSSASDEKDKTSAYPDAIRDSTYISSSYTTESTPASKSYSGGEWSTSRTRETDFQEGPRYGEGFTASRTGYGEPRYGVSSSVTRGYDPISSITRSSAQTTSKPYLSEPYVGYAGPVRYDMPVSAVTRPYASYSGSPLIPSRGATKALYESPPRKVGQPLRYETARPSCHVCEDRDNQMKQHCKICHIPGCRYESTTPALRSVVSTSRSRPLWPSLISQSYESSTPTHRNLDSLLKQPHCRICHIPGCRYESCEPDLMTHCKICHMPGCRYECSKTDLAGLAAIGPAASSPIGQYSPITPESILLKYADKAPRSRICEPALMKYCKICHLPDCRYECSKTDHAGLAAIGRPAASSPIGQYSPSPESILLKYADKAPRCGICEPELKKYCRICHMPDCRYECSKADLAGLAAIRSRDTPLPFRSEASFRNSTPSNFGGSAWLPTAGTSMRIQQLGTPTYEFNKPHNYPTAMPSPSLSKSALDFRRPTTDVTKSQPYASAVTLPSKTTSFGDDLEDTNDTMPEYNKRYHAFSARYYGLTAGDSASEL